MTGIERGMKGIETLAQDDPVNYALMSIVVEHCRQSGAISDYVESRPEKYNTAESVLSLIQQLETMADLIAIQFSASAISAIASEILS